jgi:DNA gyrase subunit A
MATNIPPHNLGELCDAVVALVEDPHLSDDALFKIIPAPDFPTGGQIMGLAGAEELYKTGKYGEAFHRLCCTHRRLIFACEHFLIVAG